MSKLPSKTEERLSPREGAQRLRLLLSWRERLALQSRRQPAAERLALREEKKLRQQARQAVEETGLLLQQALAEPDYAEEPLARLRHDIAQYNVLVKASSSSDLGGFADLPLEDYPRELGLVVIPRIWGLERDNFITIVFSLIVTVVLCSGVAWYHLWRAEVTFTIDRPDARHVSIKFQNNSSFATRLLGPWPDGGKELAHGNYGFTLYCRARDAEEFQDCTNLRDVWTYQRRGLSPTKPLSVESGTSVTVVLDTIQLEQSYGSEVVEVRIECGSPWRRRQFTFTERLRPE